MRMFNWFVSIVLLISCCACGKHSQATAGTGGNNSSTASGTGSNATGTAPASSNSGSSFNIQPAQIAALINIGTSQALSFGLGQWKDTASATLAATQIKSLIAGTVQPYLSGSQSVPSDIVNTILKDQLFTTIPVQAQLLITGAASFLNGYLQPPSANTFLSADEVSYLQAFFNGLSSGSDLYLSGHPAKSMPKMPRGEPRWLNARVR